MRPVASLTALCLSLAAAALPLRAGELQPVGQDQPYANAIEKIVSEGISAGQMPGAVVVVAGPTSVHYARSFGDRTIKPTRESMTLDTVFDLASLTKPIATASSVMKLVEQGEVDVDQPVSRYLPEFTGNGKEAVTVAQLLLHVGGLIPDNSLNDYQHGSDQAWERICGLDLIAAPGKKFAYTDVGYIVLGKLVEKVARISLEEFVHRELFQPLAMADTTFNPNAGLRARCAPTEQRDGEWIRGEVHDPRAFRLGGVAGHAGLFSTAGDLVNYGQMMLAAGEFKGKRTFNEETIALMTEPRQVPRGTRTFGWDHRTGYSRNRGESFSEAAFGHGGFTGTVFWVDPDKQLVFIFLSNRLHPDGEGSVNGLAGRIATAVGNTVAP